MENLIKDIGRSYIVSSLLPAAFFILLLHLLFRTIHPLPFLQLQTSGIDQDTIPFLQRDWVLPITFTFWLAFGLYSSVDWVVKLFEGYWLPGPMAAVLRWRQEIRYDKKLKHYHAFRMHLKDPENENLQEALGKLEKRNSIWNLLRSKKRENPKLTIPLLRIKATDEISDAELQFPLDKENLMPTRLGNILRASELYGRERYKLEGISAWNRLFKVLPPIALGELEEKHNHLLFLLNSALLSFCLAVIELFAGLWFLKFGNGNPNFHIYCFYLGSGFVLVGYVIYIISLSVTEELGIITRSCIDLYRFDLLKKLHLPIPTDIEEERTRWQYIGEFMLAGFRFDLDKSHFSYVFSEDEQWLTEKGPASSSRRRRKSYRKRRGAKG